MIEFILFASLSTAIAVMMSKILKQALEPKVTLKPIKIESDKTRAIKPRRRY